MALISSNKTKSIVGLDIETGSVAATEVRVNGTTEVVGGGTLPLGAGIFREGEVLDPDALGEAIKELFLREKLSREVRVGIANQRVAVRSMRLPAIDDRDELETAIRFQAQDHIPMPLDQAVLDWQVIGYSTDEQGGRKVDVVAVAARRDMIAQMMRALAVAGVRPIGIDHSAFGMVRALSREAGTPVGPGQYVSAPAYEDRGAMGEVGEGVAAPEIQVPAKLFCNLGDVTNLAVARGSSCLFTRIASFGMEGIAQKLAERRRLTVEHSRQWLVHVGLEQPVDAIDGDPEHVSAARQCLSEGAARLADELRASMDYYGAQEGAVAIEGVVTCGPGTRIPGLTEHLQRSLGHAFTVAKPAALAHLDEDSAVRQTLSFGLALEE